MSKPFKGTINIDIKDSTPDRAPYAQPMAPEIGQDRGEPVTEGYSGDSPWAFVGGTIRMSGRFATPDRELAAAIRGTASTVPRRRSRQYRRSP